MGCTEPERNIIGLGVRLTLYMQALGFIVLLFRGSISGAASAAEQSMVVYLAILFSLLSIDVQTSPGGGEGWKYFSDKEIVALSHLSTLYTAMFAVARSAKEMIYWQVCWLLFSLVFFAGVSLRADPCCKSSYSVVTVCCRSVNLCDFQLYPC